MPEEVVVDAQLLEPWQKITFAEEYNPALNNNQNKVEIQAPDCQNTIEFENEEEANLYVAVSFHINLMIIVIHDNCGS